MWRMTYSTEVMKNPSEVSFHSSEVSVDSSEEIFQTSEEMRDLHRGIRDSLRGDRLDGWTCGQLERSWRGKSRLYKTFCRVARGDLWWGLFADWRRLGTFALELEMTL